MAASYKRTQSEDSFEFIDQTDLLSARLTDDYKKTIPVQIQKNTVKNQISPISKRTEPVSLQTFKRFLDPDGRLVDESSLRRAVFLGGVEPSARKEVWKFLFGLYPCSSTEREREVLLLDYVVKYHEMMSRWRDLLVQTAKPGASKFEQGLIARYQLEEAVQISSPDFENASPLTDLDQLQLSPPVTQINGESEADLSSYLTGCETLDLKSSETKQKLNFMKIQAQVYVNRYKINVPEMKGYLRLIDKDVPRTDRDFPYFMGANNQHLSMLRNNLITYAAFHQDIGYAQGMNDILARFLVVCDSEVESFWLFHQYLEKIEQDFTENGMVRKIELVRKLLLEMDVQLLEHLEKNDLGDLLFCHRWLLLGFKREFSFLDSLRVFEILSSHHLELSSLEAETAKRRQQMKEFADIGGVTRTQIGVTDTEAEYTFELFMCIALLQRCRDALFKCYDAAMVFDVINKIEIDLDSILEQSEHLFFRYCKKTVEDSFLMVDTPPTR